MFLKLLQILFPSFCVSCGYLERALCSECWNKLKFEPHVRQVQNETLELKICSAMYYHPNSLLERLLHPFKYKHQSSLFRVFVPLMREALKLLCEPGEVVLVPIPLHRSRQKERGYNQAELLARFVARQTGAEVKHLLKRVRNTGSQAALHSKMERQENMKGAFQLVEAIPVGKILVLVDDVLTTGSTLLNAAELLRLARAEKVIALTLADRVLDDS